MFTLPHQSKYTTDLQDPFLHLMGHRHLHFKVWYNIKWIILMLINLSTAVQCYCIIIQCVCCMNVHLKLWFCHPTGILFQVFFIVPWWHMRQLGVNMFLTLLWQHMHLLPNSHAPGVVYRLILNIYCTQVCPKHKQCQVSFLIWQEIRTYFVEKAL